MRIGKALLERMPFDYWELSIIRRVGNMMASDNRGCTIISIIPPSNCN